MREKVEIKLKKSKAKERRKIAGMAAAYSAKWKCRDGREYTPQQMATEHIKHSIAKIERHGSWRKFWLPILKHELERRGVPL